MLIETLRLGYLDQSLANQSLQDMRSRRGTLVYSRPVETDPECIKFLLGELPRRILYKVWVGLYRPSCDPFDSGESEAVRMPRDALL
jgi:hypothetical protein